jgi:hypothetical protein
MVTILKPIPCDEFNVLYDMLEYVSIPRVGATCGRKNFGVHRSTTLGITRGRFNGIIGLSHFSKKYPHIYEEVKRIGKLLGADGESVQLNHNVVCPKHLDGNNIGESILVSFGEYAGCNIVVAKEQGGDSPFVAYNTFCQPIRFNGSLHEHYNTNDLVGNKYSLVYFNRNGR